MGFALKPIGPEAIARALEKAERYRLLNEPFFAESICLDILTIEPDHQGALVAYVLALSDQFAAGLVEGVQNAQDAVAQLTDEYSRHYYAGIVSERRGHGRIAQGGPGNDVMAYEAIVEAMNFYEKASALRPKGNDDAVLRWNTCVRLIERHRLRPPVHEQYEYPLE